MWADILEAVFKQIGFLVTFMFLSNRIVSTFPNGKIPDDTMMWLMITILVTFTIAFIFGHRAGKREKLRGR